MGRRARFPAETETGIKHFLLGFYGAYTKWHLTKNEYARLQYWCLARATMNNAARILGLEATNSGPELS